MNQLFLRDVRLEAKVGIYKRELVTTQPIALDLEIALPNDRVFASVAKLGIVKDVGRVGITIERSRG